MTIDEAIEELKSENGYYANNGMTDVAEFNTKIIRLLEELKSYRASVFSGYMTQKMLKEEYNKAIDDLLGGMNQITYNCQDADELFEKICDLAEQLKAGGENE